MLFTFSTCRLSHWPRRKEHAEASTTYSFGTRSQVPLGNALVREFPLRNHGRTLEYTDQANAKREIEFQERLRSQMEFGNEKNWAMEFLVVWTAYRRRGSSRLVPN